jgi:hypothetical protein
MVLKDVSGFLWLDCLSYQLHTAGSRRNLYSSMQTERNRQCKIETGGLRDDDRRIQVSIGVRERDVTLEGLVAKIARVPNGLLMVVVKRERMHKFRPVPYLLYGHE